jgi:putative serine protease PepD
MPTPVTASIARAASSRRTAAQGSGFTDLFGSLQETFTAVGHTGGAMNARLTNLLSAGIGALAIAAVPAVAGSDSTDPPARDASVADIYEEARPGVVDVQTGSGSGSGFAIDREGHIVTNEHVVDDARAVEVRFDGQDDPVQARVVGADASTDLALLKVDPGDVEGGIEPLELGSSEGLRVGEPTIALGSPFGLDGTLTTGVVSALDREIRAPNGFTIDEVVQTDAAINPGNSGGPLLDANGRVIGVNAQIASDGANGSTGVGFAIPVDTVREVVDALESGGEIERPYLGVSVAEAEEGGALIADLVPGGPLAEAGAAPGDVITRIGGAAVERSEQVTAAIEGRRPGDRVEVTVERDGAERTLAVRLGARPAG